MCGPLASYQWLQDTPPPSDLQVHAIFFQTYILQSHFPHCYIAGQKKKMLPQLTEWPSYQNDLLNGEQNKD
jgi:Zn/Cd-binding protein ZinT